MKASTCEIAVCLQVKLPLVSGDCILTVQVIEVFKPYGQVHSTCCAGDRAV